MMTVKGITSWKFRYVALMAAAFSLVLTISGCSTILKKPEVSVAEVRVADIDLERVQLTVTLRVRNPNPVEITLTDLKAKFWIADTEAGLIEPSQLRYVLAASSSVMLPVRVSLTVKSLPAVVQKSLRALIQGGLPYRVEGSVTTGNGLITIPFNKTGEIAKRL